MRNFLTICLIFLTSFSNAQNPWESWDKNYQSISYSEVISSENNYADSVERNPNIAQYFARLDKYKIKAIYTGKFRPIDKGVLQSIKNVYKLFVGNPEQLDKMVENEALFKVDGKEVWFPMQLTLEEPLKNEVRKGKKIILYCLFLNEHTDSKILRNTFLISEFRTQ